MSKIKEVLYEEIDDSIYTKNDVANFYWYYNLMPIDTNLQFMEEHEKYRTHHINTRNKIISDNIEYNKTPVINSAVFGISVITDKPVLIVEVK